MAKSKPSGGRRVGGRPASAAAPAGGIDLDSGVDRTDWFGPLEPLRPMAPASVVGRRFDFAPGFNITTRPRAMDGEGYARTPYAQMRALAENYDLLRLIVETRKDQLVRQKFTIEFKDKKKRGQQDSRIGAVMQFFERPDREHSWDQWLRIFLEDMLVIDAPALYPRRARGGQLYALDIVDGATIKPVIDDHGRRPLPPLPAFQQVLHGLPAVDYAGVPDAADGEQWLSAAQLLYLPRNLRVDRVYGFSAVEQIVMTVNIALRRQPAPARVLHRGHHARRAHRRAEFVGAGADRGVPGLLRRAPGRQHGAAPQGPLRALAVVQKLRADQGAGAHQRDRRMVRAHLLLRFRRQPAAVRQDDEPRHRRDGAGTGDGGRARPAQAMGQGGDRPGDGGGLGLFRPRARVAGREGRRSVAPGRDPRQGAGKGAITLDEFRAEKGRDPYPNGLGSKPIVFLAGAAMLLEQIVNPPEPQATASPEEDPAQAGARPGARKTVGTGDADLNKAAPRSFKLDPARASRARTAASLEAVFNRLFTAERARQAAAAASRPLAKAEGGDEDANLDMDAWLAAEAEAASLLGAQFADGAGAVRDFLALGVSTSLANPDAAAWAKAHAAELVSQVGDTTRARLNELVTQSESEGWSVAQLSSAIESDTAFSAERAQKIALHETRVADNQGAFAQMQAAKALGVETEKAWAPRGGNVCAACEANEADGWIGLEDDFNSGDDAAPMHPGCECDTEYRLKAEGEA